MNVEIHTRIQISASAAKQKANVCLVLHCGQNFCADDPVFQVDDATTWIVPVWVTTLQEERLAKIGELVVDAQTGEIVESEDHSRTLRRLANALLSARPPHSCSNLFRRIVLHTPHYRQTNPQGRNSRVPPAIKMVLAVQGIHIKEEELCDMLETQPVGTPVLNVSLLSRHLPNCQTAVASFSFQDLTQWLQEGVPPIAFVSTGPLEHWQTECLHAWVIVEAEEQAVLVHDPAVDVALISVPQDIFLSAWNALANLTAIVKITLS